MLSGLLQTWGSWLPRRWRQAPPVKDALWAQVCGQWPFVRALAPQDEARLRELSAHFLLEKEFHGAHGLTITDAMALSISAQACLLLLHMRLPDGSRPQQPADLLDWYDDFVGIVVQPDTAIARREVIDPSGVVHQYREVLAGEAMERGPIMLSWHEVSCAGDRAASGRNVVIHEFAHKFDMRDTDHGHGADGTPPLPPGFCGYASKAQARAHWQRTMQTRYECFREAVAMAERFGGPKPWLDDYAATHPAEFFAVCCEAYGVQRERFGQEMPDLLPLFDGLFRANVR
ncbi:MAG: zinc-dependent peptidase [Hydrogenophaga sp.]